MISDVFEDAKKCVKCGKCLPECPVYKIFQDEYGGARGKCLLLKRYLEGEIGLSKEFIEIFKRCTFCMNCFRSCKNGINFSILFPFVRYVYFGGNTSLKFNLKINEGNSGKVLFVRRSDLFEFEKKFGKELLSFLKDFEIVYYENFFRSLFYDTLPNLNEVFDVLKPHMSGDIFFWDALEGFLIKHFFFELFFEKEILSDIKRKIHFIEEYLNLENLKILSPEFLKVELNENNPFLFLPPFELYTGKNKNKVVKSLKKRFPKSEIITFYSPFYDLFY